MEALNGVAALANDSLSAPGDVLVGDPLAKLMEKLALLMIERLLELLLRNLQLPLV